AAEQVRVNAEGVHAAILAACGLAVSTPAAMLTLVNPDGPTASRKPMTSPPPSTWTLTARWVFPVAQPPLPGGTVTIAGDRIAAVEPYGSRTADVDFGNAAVLPGLVNAHTHLDLSGLRDLIKPPLRSVPSMLITDWLQDVIRHRRSLTPAQTEADIR